MEYKLVFCRRSVHTMLTHLAIVLLKNYFPADFIRSLRNLNNNIWCTSKLLKQFYNVLILVDFLYNNAIPVVSISPELSTAYWGVYITADFEKLLNNFGIALKSINLNTSFSLYKWAKYSFCFLLFILHTVRISQIVVELWIYLIS